MKIFPLIFMVSLCVASLFSEEQSISAVEDVSANEDLMREHGVLNRLLLIYQEIVRRIDNDESFPTQTLAQTVQLVRNFLENYHEKLEEEYLFPRFEKEALGELVATLKEQHEAGRKLTDYLLAHASEAQMGQVQKMILADYMRLYIKIFRPHEAREDTVVFPAFHKLLSKEEYEQLGETFEEKEHALFGKEGFEGVLKQVEAIEKRLGIYNLSVPVL